MSEIKLAAEARTEFGKGAARRIRRNDQIPAVLYGHGTAPLHVTLPGHETMLALKHANALFRIDLDETSELAIVKDVQRDPVKNVIEHVDLLIVKTGEKVSVEIAVNVVGESAPGTIHIVENQTLSIEAEATHLPESIDVSIAGLPAGSYVRAGDVALPEGSVLEGDAEQTIVSITTPQDNSADDAAAAEVAAGQSAAAAAAADTAAGL
ncbi:50S ribosomal protein L25/general stress protein Ctc [Sanguibacter suaedae]|uniref:Large ribosomal subunit protein bL25 n=1 Tax=Sanguibacter suaedae TaxID=2795737 RepID=A0A934M6V3_9MICO|nr:50S ribosomal protein L25/general stress protein Ctc [Sanguibacter suaedae]MBI9114672.1 50S ribosomal protein L25/general stress protein Ctc [Sanguibacter suaedae]